MITCLALSASLDVTYVVESLSPGEIHRPATTLKLPGGKAINVARAAVALGEQVRVIAVLGGFTGQLMEQALADQGIQTTAIRVGVETRSCVTVASLDDGRLTEIYEPATPIGTVGQSEVERALDDLTEDAGWLVLSGSIPADLDLPSLGATLRRCRDRGIRLALDTHGAALAALIDLVRPDLVKINRAEASELLAGASPSLEDLAEGVRGRSGGLVVLTDGHDGSIALGADGAVTSAPISAVGRYPVGSGDSFLAGFLVATLRGLPLGRALAVATAAAAANAAVPGAAIFDSSHALAELS